MPAIRSRCLEHVQARREDEMISSQCEKYRGVTQSEMAYLNSADHKYSSIYFCIMILLCRIPRRFQIEEIIPFADAISKLK